ncbi:MAG TPA: hypothetical protein VM680_18850 [Verrucomicrobiae bacterium]|nr:hypothetical protein [Verrucomicrobiae bacterium]
MKSQLLTREGSFKLLAVMQLGKVLLIFAASLLQSFAAGLDFQVPFYVDGKVVTRSFNTITGPADGKRLLTGLRLVPSGAENLYIGIDRSTVWRINANGERVNEAADNPDLADWSMGVAYDSQENVVDLVTLGGEGFMYQRTPSGAWSSLRSMDNKDLESLVYRAADNALYGIEVYNGAPDQPARLLKFSPSTGEKIGEIALPAFPVNLRPGDHTAKLAAVEGKIVALVERIPESYLAAGDHSRIYVIDPTTGAAELTYDNEPGHGPTVTFVSPENESNVTVNTAITLQIQAADPDNDLRFIILREEPAELRMWSLDPSPTGVHTVTFPYTPRTVGLHTIEVAVNDLSGRIAKARLTLIATNPPPEPNTAPVVTFKQPAGDISVTRGDMVNIVVEVSDAENDLRTATLLLAGTTLKTWTFENAQGAQSLTFELTTDQLGSRPIYLRATDAKGNLTEASVNLTVTDTDVSFVGWYYKDQDAIAVAYTEKGPVDGGTLFRGLPVAQAGYRYLGRDGQTVFRWDDDREQFTETAPSGEFSWPRGTTWDHRRNRFLVVTLGGEGFLYGVNPETLQWTTLTSMQNVDVDSIVYHHLDDHLYMVANLHSGGTLRILRYNAEGQPEGQGISIPNVPFDIGGYYQSRLISVGTKIALLIEPTPRWPQTPPIESRIYILDPVARTAELTYRKVWETWPPNPNPPPRIPDVAVERDLPESYTPGTSLTVRLKATPTEGVNAWAVEELPPTGWLVGSINFAGAFDRVSGKIKWGLFTDTQSRTLEYTIVPPATAVGPKSFSGFVSVNGTSKPITGDTTISGGSRYHPADAPTQDSRITANELTAYGSAWKSGAQWPRPPANIPISYVTRAGQIWKSGEFYSYNPALATPDCWIPAARQLPIAGVAASPAINEVTRTLPPAFTPGHATTVSVTVRPAAGVQSYAIEERPPAGWTIAQAEGAAAGNGSLRYGPFLDGQTRTFNYQVIPSIASTSGEFTGTASFDGSADGVQGGCVLTAPNCTAEHRNGQVYLRFNATPGENFILESATSIDSPAWNYEATIQGTQSAIELPPVEPSAKLKFYRLRPVAP